jgi:HEAT repeat protein
VERQDLSGSEILREVIEKATAEEEKWVHDAAALTVAALGPRAPREPLIALLSSPFTHVRYVGARAFRDRPDDAPYEPLLDLVDDPEEYVSWHAGLAVAALGQRIPASVLLQRLAERKNSMTVGMLLALGALSPHPPGQIVEMVRDALANAEARGSTATFEFDEESYDDPERNNSDADDDPWVYGVDNLDDPPKEAIGQEPTGREDAPYQGHEDQRDTRADLVTFGHIDAVSLMRAAVRVTGGWTEEVLASSGVERYLRVVIEAYGDPEEAGPVAEAALARLDASRPLEHWIALLHNDSWATRVKAVTMLGEFSAARVETFLSEAQLDDVGQVRRAATAALGKALARAEGHKGTHLLLEFLAADDVWLRRGALQGLSHFKDAAPIEIIRAALDDVDEDAQDAAFDALVELRAAIPEDAIERHLQGLPEWIRSELVYDLGKLGAHAPADLMVRILQNREPSIQGERTGTVPYDRMAAASVLGELGEAAPLGPLLEALQDDEFWVRGAAMQALGKLGRNAPVEIITAGLGCNDFYVRTRAAMACGHLGAAAPITRLQQALGDMDSDMRQAAQAALAEAAPGALEEVLPEALAILRGEPAGSIFGSIVQVHIAQRLGRVDAPSSAVIAMLTELLDWPYSQVREEACKALGKSRQDIPTTTIQRVQTLLGDPESEAVRIAAADALARIRTHRRLP